MEYKVSKELAEFHKLAEGCSSTVYLDSGGIPTIGIGHANQDHHPFVDGDTWSERQILDAWEADIAIAEGQANKALADTEVPQRVFDALVDLIFNTGVVPKTMLSKIYIGDIDGAIDQLSKWIFVNRVVVGGLVKRRMAMIAYVNEQNWEEIMNYPLKTTSDESISGFNEVIAKLGYRFSKQPDSPQKFVVERVS